MNSTKVGSVLKTTQKQEHFFLIAYNREHDYGSDNKTSIVPIEVLQHE